MKSLADYLGVADQKESDSSDSPAASAPASTPTKLTVKSFAREVLNSREYRQSILNRVLLGDLPPAVECLLYHYAYGKPVERLEVEDTTPTVDNMSPEQCEQRALFLAGLARKMREQQEEDEHPTSPDTRSVH